MVILSDEIHCDLVLPGFCHIPFAKISIWLDCRKFAISGKELQSFFVHKAGVGMNEGSTFGPGGEG